MRDCLGERAGLKRGADRSESCRPGQLRLITSLIAERTGLPLFVGISSANVHDSQAQIPLVKDIPPVRSRRGPRRRRPAKLHADKGYDYRHLRR
ncbi:transposase [Streptomyces sp. L06]|nr:transposase [Streptomyces sp. L06]